ncbi:hypothetical protein WJ977_31475 [Achromobacter xylosoxidans]
MLRSYMRKRHTEYSRQLIDFVRELRPPAPIAAGLLPKLTIVTPRTTRPASWSGPSSRC